MAKAYLKIVVEAGKEREVCSALKRMQEVRSADITTGDQDIIAVVEAPSYEILLKTIVEKLRQISGVSSTSTSLVLD
ncbi:MAG: Lrp/AsnC ligand binding domain-containing protein [Candidatus Lindowbacteria bacterium]|nr:Lrp/AsnC ligand binding domain-containing protein [Candidatus Lindowbacteria bacterium]